MKRTCTEPEQQVTVHEMQAGGENSDIQDADV
jgi:hypothetical protein